MSWYPPNTGLRKLPCAQRPRTLSDPLVHPLVDRTGPSGRGRTVGVLTPVLPYLSLFLGSERPSPDLGGSPDPGPLLCPDTSRYDHRPRPVPVPFLTQRWWTLGLRTSVDLNFSTSPPSRGENRRSRSKGLWVFRPLTEEKKCVTGEVDRCRVGRCLSASRGVVPVALGVRWIDTSINARSRVSSRPRRRGRGSDGSWSFPQFIWARIFFVTAEVATCVTLLGSATPSHPPLRLTGPSPRTSSTSILSAPSWGFLLGSPCVPRVPGSTQWT